MPELIAAEPEIISPSRSLLAVSACPHPFEQRRIDYAVPYGLTIAEIIEVIQPDPLLREHGCVYIGDHLIPRQHWRRVRPTEGARLTIRLLPASAGVGRLLATIAVVILAAVASFYLGPAAGMLVSMVGMTLINVLLPPPKPEIAKNKGIEQKQFFIQGARNRADIWGKVPFVCGWNRLMPPYAALPYREVMQRYFLAGDLRHRPRAAGLRPAAHRRNEHRELFGSRG